VRRRFSPVQIGGCVLWLDAHTKRSLYTDSARTTPVVNSGDPVGGWEDLSGVSNHATQTSSGQKPSYAPTGCSGGPGATLDGVDDLLSTVGSINVAQGTTFIVQKTISRIVNAGFFKFANIPGVSTGQGVLVYDPGATLTRIANANAAAWDTAYTGISPSSGSSNLWTVRWKTSSELTIRKDRVAGTYSAGGYTQPTASVPMHIGSGYQTKTSNVCIGAILHYSRALTDSEVSLVESYLRGTWGTP